MFCNSCLTYIIFFLSGLAVSSRTVYPWLKLAPVNHLANCLHLSSAKHGKAKKRIEFITIVLQFSSDKGKSLRGIVVCLAVRYFYTFIFGRGAISI